MKGRQSMLHNKTLQRSLTIDPAMTLHINSTTDGIATSKVAPATAADNKAPRTLPKGKILALSFDFDHALAFNLTKLRALKTDQEKIQQILIDNKPLLKILAELAVTKGYEEVMIFIGTNRQSWSDDFHCGFVHPSTQGSGSSFQLYEVLKESLIAEIKLFKQNHPTHTATPSVTLNKTTLADVYNLQPHGTAVQNAIEHNNNLAQAKQLFEIFVRILLDKKNHPLLLQNKLTLKQNNKKSIPVPAPTLFDTSKISLLYHQIQNIVNYRPDKEIHFLFFDDNLHKILNSLINFYNNHENFIPENVLLTLHSYNNGIATPLRSIQGTGKPDEFFEENILIWAAITLNIIKLNDKKEIIFDDKILKIEEINIEKLREQILVHFTKYIGGDDITPYQHKKTNSTAAEVGSPHTPDKAAHFDFIRQHSAPAILRFRQEHGDKIAKAKIDAQKAAAKTPPQSYQAPLLSTAVHATFKYVSVKQQNNHPLAKPGATGTTPANGKPNIC